MNDAIQRQLITIRRQVRAHLLDEIIPFWLARGQDAQFGGYLTCFDGNGELDRTETDKYLVTQTRMIWGFSLFSTLAPHQEAARTAARQGVDFLIAHFWDREDDGWCWRTDRSGSVLDCGKVVYGQSFALYALAQYTASTGDVRGLDYAIKTFDLLVKFCADTGRGGYYENLEADWRLSPSGFAAGDRKSLDIHMHLLEAFTTLYQVSHLEIHRRRLEEVIEVIVTRMIHREHGCGLNQFDLSFKPLTPIVIRRTWNAERVGALADGLPDTTSYGHNLELAWLLLRAFNVLGRPCAEHRAAVIRLGEHALAYGVDWRYGGVFRDGPHQGPAVVRDKEWWQQSESLVGFLAEYAITGDDRYLEAFILTWNFADQHLINHELGEWRTLVSETGDTLSPVLGNPWKACYHTGRAMYEILPRLDEILSNAQN